MISASKTESKNVDSAAAVLLINKIIGAMIGSSVAIVFKPGGDSWLKLVQRFVLGTIIGVISAPVLIDLFGWNHTVDYWLASAAFGGLVGYLALQVLFSDLAKAIATEILKKRVHKK